jgi:hypothetical protein
MPSDDIARLYNFTAGTTIQASQANAELNQLTTTMNSKFGRGIANTLTGNNTFSGANTFSGITTFSSATTPIKSDKVDEYTSATGVTIDSVLLKDGYVKPVPTTQPYAPAANGEFGYDSTNHKYMVRVNGSNQFLIHDGNVTANALPSQTSNSGKFLTTNGTVASWGAVIFTLSYVSSDQTITAAGSLTLAHSLGVAPKIVAVELVCQTGEQGYSAGDVIAYHTKAGATTNRDLIIVPDSTNLNIRFGSAANTFSVIHKTTGVDADLTNGNWKVRFKAYA